MLTKVRHFCHVDPGRRYIFGIDFSEKEHNLKIASHRDRGRYPSWVPYSPDMSQSKNASTDTVGAMVETLRQDTGAWR